MLLSVKETILISHFCCGHEIALITSSNETWAGSVRVMTVAYGMAATVVELELALLVPIVCDPVEVLSICTELVA